MARAMAMASVLLALLAMLSLPAFYAFYLPGVAPQDFNKGAELFVKVNKLTSTKTQLPYVYYDLPYCKPGKIINNAENLGEVLRGDRIENSPFTFQMRESKLCNLICKMDKLSAEDATKFKDKIDDDYRVNMILDNLPVAIKRERRDGSSNTNFYERGFPVGFKVKIGDAGKEEDKFFIHNHLAFEVLYHLDPETATSRIVGFEVIPYSVHHEYEKPWDPKKPRFLTCSQNAIPPQQVEEGQEVIFTYDVTFQAW